MTRIWPSLQLAAFDNVLDAVLSFQYEDRNYLEELRDARFDRDGNYVSWGLDANLALGKWVSGKRLWQDASWGACGPNPDDRDYERPMEVYLGLDFDTVSTQGDEFDYESQIFSVGTSVPLPYGIDFLVRAFFEWQDYRQHSLVDRRRRGRQDFIQEYSFRLERPFYLTSYDTRKFEYIRPLQLDRIVMMLYGELRFTIDDSNVRDRLGQSIFEYNRVIYSAGVRFDIN